MRTRHNSKRRRQALAQPGARVFDMTGRPMRGWIVVDGAELDDDVLSEWIERARSFVVTYTCPRSWLSWRSQWNAASDLPPK